MTFYGNPYDKKKALTSPDYWKAIQPEVNGFSRCDVCPPWHNPVADYLPQKEGVRCLEIGAVLGRSLLFLAARYGYSCVALDFLPAVRSLEPVFHEQGLTVRVIEKDFMTWESEDKFDIVYSCGFVEHFKDCQMVIDKHWRFVRDGGMMIRNNLLQKECFPRMNGQKNRQNGANLFVYRRQL